MKNLATLVLVLLAATGVASAQCGKLVLNPITGKLDCAGVGSPNGPANISNSSTGSVSSLALNTTSLNQATVQTILVQCWTGTTTSTPVTITSLNPITTIGGIVTAVTANFSATANVYCTANASGGVGPTGPSGPTGAAGAPGAAGSFTAANNTGTGTTLHLLAKNTAVAAQVVLAATTDTAVPVWIVTAGAGTSGSATLALGGPNQCTFDAAGVTVNDYVGESTATNGRCMDLGTTPPANTYVVGTAAITGAGNTTVQVNVNSGFLSGGGGGGTGSAAAIHSVSFSATPTLTGTSATAGTVDTFNIGQSSANITGITLSTLTPGQIINIDFQQAASGGPYTVTYGGSFIGACAISAFPSAHTKSTWYISSGPIATLTAGGCNSDSGPSYSSTLTRSGVATPSSGAASGVDTSSNIPFTLGADGVYRDAVKEVSGIRQGNGANVDDSAATTAQMQTAIGMPNCAADGSHALTNSSGTMGCTAISGGSPVAPAGYGYVTPMPGPAFDYSGVQASTANTVYLVGFNQAVGVTVTKGHTFLAAGVNGSTTYWGLYKGDCSALVLSGSSLSPASAGVSEISYTVTSTAVPAGYYYLAIGSDTSALNFSGAGIGTAGGQSFNNGTHPQFGTIVGGISGGALPATCTAMTRGGMAIMPSMLWDN